MVTFLLDLRHAVRKLSGSPGFTLAAVLTLALGIGANTAIFSIVDAVLLRPLPYPESDRLVAIWETDPNHEYEKFRVAGGNFLEWRSRGRSLSAVGLLGGSVYTLDHGEAQPEQIGGARVSAEYFSVLDVAPILGRTFTPEDNEPGAEPVTLLSYELWRSRFGADPGVIGRRIVLDDSAFTVVGVMPPGPYPIRAPTGAEVPLSYGARHVWTPIDFGKDWVRGHRTHVFVALARLAPDVTVQTAEAELQTVAAALEAEFPDTNSGWGVRVVPLREEVAGEARPALLVLLGAVGLVLLLGCANLVNLMLARATGRSHELALRAALGAGRLRLSAQLLAESLALAGIGGLLGLAVAAYGTHMLVSLYGGFIPRAPEVGVSLPVLLFNAGLCVTTGLVVGFVPLFQIARSDLRSELVGAGRTMTGERRSRRLRRGLVVSEVTLAVVLTVGAGLLVKSFWRLLQVDPGFEPERVLAVELVLPGSRYETHEELTGFSRRLLERLETLPGVSRAAAAMDHPLQASWIQGFAIEGRPLAQDEEPPVGRYRPVSPGYFRTMGIPLVRGREFSEADRPGAPGVVIVNESLARRYFAGRDPLGERLRIDPPRRIWGEDMPASFEIVGIVRDVKFLGLDAETEPATYLPFAQAPYGGLNFLLRGEGRPEVLTPAVRSAIARLDPALAVTAARTMNDVLGASLADRRFNMLLLGTFGVAALLLAGLGVYGVVSYTVAERSGEMGVRIALGAIPSRLLGWILLQEMMPVTLGLVLGLALALAAGRLMAGLTFGIASSDPATLAGVVTLLGLVSAGAAYLPARRAARIDPVATLRRE